MRSLLRSLATLVLSVGVVTCSEGPNAPKKQTAGRGAFALAAAFSKSAADVYAQRATFADVNFDHVRIILVKPPSDTVKDTTIVFDQNSPPKTIDLTVDVKTTGETFSAVMDYTNNGSVVFHGEATVQSHPVDQTAPPAQVISLRYVGPGASVTRVVVSPKTATVIAPTAARFTVQAFDANNAVVSTPIAWSSSDPSVAPIDAASGSVAPTGKRGTATLTARAPAGASDNGSLTVTLPPSGLALVSGGGQTGKAGSALGQTAVVRVTASDGVGVGGVTVNFAAPAGGKVGASSVTSDASGVASTILTLGGAVGPQSFAASAAGFSVSIVATATAGDPANIAAASGSGQADTVRKVLAQPFVARVSDQFGNPVSGVTVSWARTAGAGTLTGATSTTSAEGLATIGYTLGATPGTESITASANGVSSPATFTANALSSGPAAIAAVAGGGQTGRIQQALSAPFTVRVTDNQSNPVSGASVTWTATNGSLAASTTTDADGRSSNLMTLGSTVGPAAATATVRTATSTVSVTFNVTVQPGVVGRLAFRTQPVGTTVGATLAPVRIELLDASGNLTSAANPVSIAIGTNPSGATLNGTLTRTSVSGVATFDDLVMTKAGVGYTLVVSSAGTPSITSTLFDVTGLPTVHAVSVSPATAALVVGGTVNLVATVTADAGVSQAVTWSSSDPTKATVNTTGTVTAVAPGTAAIIATSVFDQTVKGAASITVSPPSPPNVTISSVNTTVCNPTCVSVPANLSNSSGQLDFTLVVQPNGSPLQSVTVQLLCPATTSTIASQSFGTGGPSTGSFPITLSINTASYNATTGVPTLRNGACSMTASATSTAGSSGGGFGMTLNNPDAVVLSNSFAPIANAEGVTQLTSANDAAGMPWRSGSVTVGALPILYSGKTIASVSITLPNAITPTVTVTSAPYQMTWSGTATTGPRVTGLTLVDATGCVAPAVPPACGALETNGITPKGVAPVVTAADASGNALAMTLLNPNTPASTFRIDNTPPEAPLAFNTPTRQVSWVNASYVFTGVGGGTSNALLGLTQNFISCGDGPSAAANPYTCQPQIGVSASANGQVGVGTAINNGSSNGKTTFTYFAIPVAAYVPASTTDGTATSNAACSTTGWAQITTAGDLAATLTNSSYAVRVFERDVLGNARCTDLAVSPANAAALGTVINTGVAGRFNAANQGKFGVDKVAPSIVFIEPSAIPTAAAAFQTIQGGPVPAFTLGLTDDASGFIATPVNVSLTRLAIDPATGNPAATNSAFGCPIGFSGGVCGTTASAPITPVDANSNIDGYYTYTGSVLDLARNQSPTIQRSVLVDRTAPVAGPISVPGTIVGGASTAFATTATDNLDLVIYDWSLLYPVSPSGSPVSNFVMRSSIQQIGVAFDNVLTRSVSYSIIAPVFIRSLATTAAATPAPQNNGVLPTQITQRVYDAAGNASAPSPAVISPGNISQTNPTNYAAPQTNGAAFQSFQVSNVLFNVSNCPATGCVGQVPPANPTSVVLTATASGSLSGTFQFANPFTQVQFYNFDSNSGEWILIGASGTPTVTDNGPQTVRTFTWSVGPFDPPAALGSGASLRLVAVGVNATGDALVSAVNSNINLTNP